MNSVLPVSVLLTNSGLVAGLIPRQRLQRPPAAILARLPAGQFPYFVTCKACSFMTDHVRIAGVAVKL
jgi:hypothetical protein